MFGIQVPAELPSLLWIVVFGKGGHRAPYRDASVAPTKLAVTPYYTILHIVWYRMIEYTWTPKVCKIIANFLRFGAIVLHTCGSRYQFFFETANMGSVFLWLPREAHET